MYLMTNYVVIYGAHNNSKISIGTTITMFEHSALIKWIKSDIEVQFQYHEPNVSRIKIFHVLCPETYNTR